MSDYNENVDEFSPAAEPTIQPAEQVQPAEPNAYDAIIKQQSEQINALIAHNESLTSQITQLIKNGAQIGAPSVQQPNITPLGNLNTSALASNDDFSLEALASEIGKKPHHG